MVKVGTVVVDIPPGTCSNPDKYRLSAHFRFGEAQITVRCVDEQTGQERRTSLIFDSSECTKESLMMLA
mgnify:CR=1 FL=1